MLKQSSRYLRIIIPLTILFYFAPVIAIILVACGVFDISRHRVVTADLMTKYFVGNGLVTWLLSPVNVFLDLISERNKYVYALADFPPQHRAEIEHVLKVFDDDRDEIIADIRKKMGDSQRGMLFYKWYDKNTNDSIAAFNKEMTYIKTIGVSVFNKKESTSLHFGPLRLTLRVLYNLTPLKSDNVFIEVDGQKHYWHDDPLFIFDDTLLHRSINGEDNERYCVFVDVLRPSSFTRLQNVIMKIVQVAFNNFSGIFYGRWTFLK
ncbi:MAG: aspartyl/asparaginyl beta-hydroxylase domain-containing protein [Alphaproteobacteria bacterium]|nr:aspartyl/asparaginyl beta-hydroxylase domain-containing protein [Alphaproteobacteria bacterium]